jgi:hypothetical protein
MRRSTTFTIDGLDRQIEVRELTVREIIELGQTGDAKLLNKIDEGTGDNTVAGTLEDLRNFLEIDFLPKVTNLKLSELLDLTPSAIEEIYKQFQEVNKSFFALAGATGLGTLGSKIKKALINDFSAMLADSLSAATSTYGSTDTPTS